MSYEDYVETALWADYNDDMFSDELFYDTHAHSEAVVKPMLELCQELVTWFHDVYDINTVWSDEGQIAHDLYLTRCGHGAGFWDQYFASQPGDDHYLHAWLGDRLTAIAKAWEVV